MHAPAWTPEQVADFWDNYGSIAHFRPRFFSLSWSEGILEFAEKFTPKSGVILDYGCGRGDLLDVLLARGRRCLGGDSSPDSVRTVSERFAGNPNFLGAFVTSEPTPPVTPDIVTLVEVIEHLPDGIAPKLLAGIAALLPSGGHLVVTCPNQEDLQAAEVLCPECACRFHPVQHLQSLSAADLARLGEGAGFRTVFAGATRFRKKGESALKRAFLAGWYGLFGKAPHLVYVGQKR